MRNIKHLSRFMIAIFMVNIIFSTVSVAPVAATTVSDIRGQWAEANTLVLKAGTFGPAGGTTVVDGNVNIKAGNVTIQNTVINGDLKIDKAVGEGTVTLKGISVKGNTYINGGGTNSVHFIDSQIGETYVQKDNGAVRIVASGTTGIAHLIAQSSVDLEETDLSGKGFDDIVVDRRADGTITVNIAGVNIESLTVNTANTNIVTNVGTGIASFVANAAVNVSGDGKISNAIINASGVTLDRAPTQQTVAAGVSAPVVSTTGTSTLSGWVNSSQAVSEANLTVYDTEADAVNGTVGKQIDTPESSTTSEYGSFVIAVDNLPSDFRIVAQGGKCGGEAFPGELMADYRNFNPKKDRVYINIVTTMVSVYLDKHPDVTLDKAVAVVKKFLNIPEFLDIGRNLHSANEYFSPTVFVNEAGGNNHIREYIEQLVVEIDSGEGVTHSFPEVASNGLAEDAAKLLAEKIVGGAASYAGGKAMGWGLKECGLGGVFETDDGNAKANQEMKQELNQMEIQLDRLEVNLKAVNNNLSNQIKQSTNRIVLQQLKSEFDIRSHMMTDLADSIRSIRDIYMDFLVHTPEEQNLREVKREDLKNAIRDDLVMKRGVINSQLMGAGMTVPLLDILANIAQYDHRFLSTKDNASVQAILDYYKVLQTWQLELVVEYYHATGEGEKYHDGITMAIDNYDSYIQAQENKAVMPIPENVLIDKEQPGIMLYVGEDRTGYKGYALDSSEQITNMNSSSYLSFNNWRYTNYDELFSILRGGSDREPAILPNEYLKKSGWGSVDPVTKFVAVDKIYPSQLSCYFVPVGSGIFSLPFDYELSDLYENLHAAKQNWIFCRSIGESEKYVYKD